ncbi:MAG: Rab5-interacting family protein [Candidatus Heimdallarchaeota archaeon]|nr:Rab5-interacting family protein [Candidatus Heimdallarchaeota archaeon]MCK5182806.1 Rab5-interacting family protein [Candidatus Heimdallarchaeota archaeon]
MSKKKPKQKGSSKSKKEVPKKEKKVELSEYEDSYDGDTEDIPPKEEDDIDYDQYELPEDFVRDEKEEIPEEDMNWFQRRRKALDDMANDQRLYWIKILSGCITGIILGFAGAQTGWWLLLMIGLYAAITAGGFFLFKLEWSIKGILLSGFFPYLALFTLFWTLMFTSTYAPSMTEWWPILISTITIETNGTQIITTSTNTTSAAGVPWLAFVIIIVSTLGLMQFLLRRQSRREKIE